MSLSLSVALRAAMVVVAGSTLTGCEAVAFGDSNRYREDFRQAYPMQPGSRLVVDNRNGSVEVMGWERSEIEVTGTRYASTEEALRDIRIQVEPGAGEVRVRSVLPRRGDSGWGMGNSGGVRYVIRVPQRAVLDEVVTSNGAIRAENLQGTARLRTSNGRVEVLRLQGDLDVTTSNGSVEARELTGSATVRTSNGAISLEDVRGRLEATTSNGSIRARLSDPVADQPVRLTSSNGAVDLTMEAVRNNPVQLTTSNSSITLRLPATVDAELEADTSNSRINSDFDVQIGPGKLSKGHVSGRLGRGGAPVTLRTSNGNINVRRL